MSAKKQEKAAMDGRPTLEQWKELFAVAQNINQLAPWNFLWESDLITIMLPGREEPVYCSVMGRGGECYAVAAYPGYGAIDAFYRLANSEGDEEDSSALALALGFEQECLACHFGNREEVLPEDREVYASLGLRFRGRNEWIYFRTMDPGYVPWHIDSEQADLLIQTLQNFFMALTHLLREKIEVDFEGGQTLLRFYSPEKELWINTAVKMPPRPVVVPKLIVDNESLMDQLKKHKSTSAQLEFETTYLPAPIQETKDERPRIPRLALLMDKKSGLPISQRVADINDRIEVDILEMLTAYIKKAGKPASINVRNESSGRYIEDFCQKLGIKLVSGKGVPAIDGLLENMLRFMR